MQPKNLLIIMSDQHSRGAIGLLRAPDRAHAQPRPAGGARHALHLVLEPIAGLHPGARVIRDRQVHPPDRLLGQRRPVRRFDPELAPSAARLPAIGSSPSASCTSARTRTIAGSPESIVPMQVVEGKGDLLGLIRDDLPVRGAAYKMARMAGPGESPYTQYDREIAARAQIWLREEAPKYRRQALGSVRVVRRAALPADRAAGALLSLLR